MTVGEKIKYLRERMGLTQSQLAEVAGLHPVSIGKYEINKMQPQPPQIGKLAAALNVSPNALNGLDSSNFRLETVGDLIGIIILLCNARIISIKGDRSEDDLLVPETVSLHFDNPLLLSFIKASLKSNNDMIDLNALAFKIPDKLVLPNLIQWEKMNYLYNNALKNQISEPDEETKAMIADMAVMKEVLELELQRSALKITEKGLSVLIGPDLSKFI